MTERKPTFFWQGFLILLPMLLLTLVGIVSLWHDQVNSRREANERALKEADQILASLASRFSGFPNCSVRTSTDSNLVQIELFGETARFAITHGQIAPLFAINSPASEQTFRFNSSESWVSTPLDKPLEDPLYHLSNLSKNLQFYLCDDKGNLLYPPLIEDTPQPSFDDSALSPELRTQWRLAHESALTNAPFSIQTYTHLFEANPPESFLAQARYNAAVLAAQAGDLTNACRGFEAVASDSPNTLSETGIPLQLLARYQMARLRQNKSQDLMALAATAVLKPSILSKPVLDQARVWARTNSLTAKTIENWWTVWKAHENTRQIAGAAAQTNRVEAIGETWIRAATPLPTPGCHLILSRRESSLKQELQDLLSQQQVPPYLSLQAKLVGSSVLITKSSSSSPALQTNVLVAVDIPLPGKPQTSLCRLSCTLQNPDLLYRAQQRRQLIFGAFIAMAAISAAAGFFAARRAFHRQIWLNQMKSNFVSAVSHELRAPIASVRLLAEGLDRGKVSEPPKQREYFRFIVQECRRLSSLIENVLDFSRIEQGRKKYEFEPTDIVALVRQTAKLMSPCAEERQVRIDLEIPQTEIPLPSCDGLALQQALINLVDNAIKHSPQGCPVLIGVAPCSPGKLQLWVQDRGPGIPPEEHEKIFERFYRRGSELRRETQGIGIGLTIVKHITEAHGGHVTVRSAVGSGSRFTIELPYASNTGR